MINLPTPSISSYDLFKIIHMFPKKWPQQRKNIYPLSVPPQKKNIWTHLREPHEIKKSEWFFDSKWNAQNPLYGPPQNIWTHLREPHEIEKSEWFLFKMKCKNSLQINARPA